MYNSRCLEIIVVERVYNVKKMFDICFRSQPDGLRHLVALYVGRCSACWREPEVMAWLERNVRSVLRTVDGGTTDLDALAQKSASLVNCGLRLFRDVAIGSFQANFP